MYTFEAKSVVFNGTLKPAAKPAAEQQPPALDLCRPADQRTFYSILSQSSDDLRDQENSPAMSMWPYLLASAQTQHLNQISIYVEPGTTADKLRFLYLNDFALRIWSEMKQPTQVMGRLRRPPRGATLSFGMPFSE